MENHMHEVQEIIEGELPIGSYNVVGAYIRRLHTMLYEMTSLTDWLRNGHSEAEYNVLLAMFEDDTA